MINTSMQASLIPSPEMRERILLVLLAIAVFSPYFAINLITASWPAHDLSTRIDQLIPFQPIWELIYVSIYFYIFVPVVYVKDRQIFRRAVLAFCSMQLICFAVYLLLPVGIERPLLGNIDQQFLHWGVALNYLLDQPRNLFPSLHLGNAFMVSLLLIRLDRKLGQIALIWASLIGYSTLAVKHHLFGDVVSGIALALLIDRLMFAPLIKAPPAASAFYPRRRLIELVALYPATIALLYGLWLAGWRPFQWPVP